MGKKHKTTHHRRPRSLDGDDSVFNTSTVTQTKHRAWHCLFSNMNPYQIAEHINSVWLDPEYEFVVKRRENRKW